MLAVIKKIFGTKNDRDLKRLLPLVDLINSFEAKMKQLSDDELKAQTNKFKEMLKNGTSLESIMPEAFATVREAGFRILNERAYDVQLMGAITLFEGKIAEMKTGEGKTLAATFPLYLHGLTGNGAHLVTVNDYLAKRDSQWTGKIPTWLGLTVGCITSDISEEERHQAYQSDITYGTNNEFAFDYLRDNMKFSLEDYVQRQHNFCIVDEVDSILIDEARTPLLISGPSQGSVGLYTTSNKLIPMLTKDAHFTVDEKSRSSNFTDEGINFIQEKMNINNIFSIEHVSLLHYLNQSLRAHHLFKKDVDYVVKDDKIVIVDEFTGRLKEGSRWSDGLHGAIEAKEGLTIKTDNQTLASITFQNYFKLYSRLAGMTGTADTEAEEFMKIYNLDVVVIPTNVPMIRIDQPDLIYKNAEAKYRAVVNLIKELHKKGQPVLVGTISIDNNEKISKILKKDKIPHEVLNAKQHEREALIIKDAGQKGAVTIATNMAGRGTDIKLSKDTKELGGLFILCTERHEARRIDNQLRGRSGRQGDPGESRFFLSLEDDLMRIFGSKKIQGIMNTLGMHEDEPIEHKMITNAIAKAQKKVEGYNFEIRKHLLEYDNVMNEQRRVIYRIRKEILSDKDNMGFIMEMIEDVATYFVDAYRPARKVPIDSWAWSEMQNGLQTTFNINYKLTALECSQKHDGNIEEYIASIAKKSLEEKFSGYAQEQIKMALREILLSIFDKHWKDHLQAMDSVKEGINLRAYAQKDPLNEYKRESFELFTNMKIAVKKSVVDHIFKVQFYTPEEIEELKRRQQAQLQAQLDQAKEIRKMAEDGSKTIRRGQNKVGRNDPCPCGSGKKFKQCHGA
ncbi:MAG: preprotein translocase subunit SecA [Bdellovibrionales bacterium RIFOXYB1_FULL_37_110]|nr:MAG: preprotein translocase subunit SecA [Bdellovibrionales bacterium RIFOXYA1_FULL_38_20]OFZ51437.1 MAG: preprotein translocase subunit SecA [Bdellovibrionales bacterium RIFOXYC1_FULL_37_79]OFZ57865.1 MAG: preprotein translocase subunit SecA [Bdellovibrionales bacterium RIFOXYB1_FULL_37_110]OFZ63591.1 MAG: preprotein translocase subunit SecA [Bdellovibrionales bacterium RIFOXYD1_FULL_36_51]